jgi:hypothetical protein
MVSVFWVLLYSRKERLDGRLFSARKVERLTVFKCFCQGTQLDLAHSTDAGKAEILNKSSGMGLDHAECAGRGTAYGFGGKDCNHLALLKA